MISLFIDTSLENVSISVIKNNQILSLIKEYIPNKHSIYTTSYLKKVIDDAGIKTTDISNIFVVNGPGSFTGLRIGVTIAKTYGFLIDKEIIPISSLKEIALSIDYQDIALSIIKANKTDYYIGMYDKFYNEIEKERFATKEEVLMLIDKYNPLLISSTDIKIDNINIKKIDLDIIKIINYYFDKDKVSYYSLVPNYLKLPQAQIDRSNNG